jgi:hypothetical protein
MQVADSAFFRKIDFGQFVVGRGFQADTRWVKKRCLYQCGDFGQRLQRVAPDGSTQLLQFQSA